MERLEGIVARLEGDETLGLEEAIALYREGAALAGACRQRLATAQLTMTELPMKAPDADEPPDEPPDGPPNGPPNDAAGAGGPDDGDP
jgi:exodeoxyribonuclease VII small subunit